MNEGNSLPIWYLSDRRRLIERLTSLQALREPVIVAKPCIALIPHPLLPIVGEGDQNRQRLAPTLGREI